VSRRRAGRFARPAFRWALYETMDWTVIGTLAGAFRRVTGAALPGSGSAPGDPEAPEPR
jgi:hypothetical protein